jgi:hypothetical protein
MSSSGRSCVAHEAALADSMRGAPRTPASARSGLIPSDSRALFSLDGTAPQHALLYRCGNSCFCRCVSILVQVACSAPRLSRNRDVIFDEGLAH